MLSWGLGRHHRPSFSNIIWNSANVNFPSPLVSIPLGVFECLTASLHVLSENHVVELKWKIFDENDIMAQIECSMPLLSTTNTHQSVKEDLLPQILNMRPDFRFACQICQNHQKSGDSQLSYQWKHHILITRFGPAKKMPTTHLTCSKGWTCSGLRLKATLNSKGGRGIRIRDNPRCAKCQLDHQYILCNNLASPQFHTSSEQAQSRSKMRLTCFRNSWRLSNWFSWSDLSSNSQACHMQLMARNVTLWHWTLLNKPNH